MRFTVAILTEASRRVRYTIRRGIERTCEFLGIPYEHKEKDS